MSKHFISDPGKWVAITSPDLFVIWDIVGWEYDDQTETSVPMVTRAHGVERLRLGVGIILERWEGVKFGSNWPLRGLRVPEYVTDEMNKMHTRLMERAR